MARVWMDSNTEHTCTATLPKPSGAAVVLVNGIGFVDETDVPVAVKIGWKAIDDQSDLWPGLDATNSMLMHTGREDGTHKVGRGFVLACNGIARVPDELVGAAMSGSFSLGDNEHYPRRAGA